MKGTRLTILALLIVLLPGCAMTAAIGATAWAGVKTAATIVKVVEIVWSDGEEPEAEETEDDGEETQNSRP